MAIYALGTVLFFSGALLSLAGGALFGPVWGTAWNLAGATLGAMCGRPLGCKRKSENSDGWVDCDHVSGLIDAAP